MTKEEIAFARKVIKEQKSQENFMMITVSYDNKILLTHKDGLAFLAALSQAEKIKNDYGDSPKILPLEKDSITSSIISGEEYQQIKMAQLLKVSLKELQESMEAA